MTVKRLFNDRPTFTDVLGSVSFLASNYRLFFYAAGTSTKQNTYNSITGLSANSNPILLNSLGQPSTEIWVTAGLTYKLGLAIPGSDDPPNSFVWTEDNISGINDVSVLSIFIDSNLTPTFISTTSFTVPGDQTVEIHKGRRLKLTVTAGTVYGYIYSSVFTTLTTVTMIMEAGQVLDAGLSSFQKSLVPETNSALPFQGTPQTISGNTTLLSTDFSYNNFYSKITATAIVSLPAVSTVGISKKAFFMVQTSGVVKLTPNGTDTIGNSNSPLTLNNNDLIILTSNGSTDWAVNRSSTVATSISDVGSKIFLYRNFN